ncbi:hypothetical protein NQ317_003889 [Molorchus minor]|uniref:Uncharacterized protein n=1 Tax=Molorchus minor TaxID=1323400 RepID=A0ABQ9JGI6_9CUCU|nr:hypothetical protein NQ317_003889 [Molorchus minor]
MKQQNTLFDPVSHRQRSKGTTFCQIGYQQRRKQSKKFLQQNGTSTKTVFKAILHYAKGMVSKQEGKMEEEEEDHKCVPYPRCFTTFPWSSPFGAMGDGLCGSSMFSTSESRWGVAGMASGLGQLGQGSMGGFGQSLGQLNQNSGLSPALPISTASTVYQAHYGLNSLDMK